MEPLLQRRTELEAYITMMEEAKKRDHRKLGKELGLFMMHEEGPGFPFFLPKGMVLKNTLLDYWREIHRKAGYVEISTPDDLKQQASGRPQVTGIIIKNNMYTTVIDERRLCDQADELPRRRFGLCSLNPVLTEICRCVWASLVWYTVMKNPVSCMV